MSEQNELITYTRLSLRYEDEITDQRSSGLPQPQRVFNKARNTRRPAGTVQTSPVQATIEPVEVATGRDRVVQSSIPVTTLENHTVAAHAPPQSIPSTDLLSPAITPHEPSSSTVAAVTSAPLSIPSNSATCVPVLHSSPRNPDVTRVITPSLEEIEIINDLRRRKMLDNIV
ncbi:hypothetical protein PAXINDRAFT_14809 [Paxillus involutus ATCC 200175]|uniref:Unplaced genomic scaffold PAXINscaffold_43, whole genome shotgun sequence n=1 Tax=Paxillus involutus ATCC 200175 TaxID=664439 RepID=A0A0C9TYG7_PAXIN|nr:hypothetical protein PAXINDRAFT_14809 [Paxillus involutus ATCC 200175]